LLTRYFPALIIILSVLYTDTANSAESEANNNTKNKPLTMCISHYPPYQIVLPDQTPIGENIAATTHFFNKLGFTIRFTQNNSFWRCLGMLKAGKVDIMSGLLDAPERRKFAHLLAYSSLDKKSFYVKKNGPKIRKFSDLKGLKVAVLKEIKQFKQFDNAPNGYFEKVYVNDMAAAFRVLVAGKVDVVVSTDFSDLDKFRKQNTQEIEEITVNLDQTSLLFIGLSKKSKIAHLAPKLSELSQEMYKNDEFNNIISEFKITYPEHYH